MNVRLKILFELQTGDVILSTALTETAVVLNILFNGQDKVVHSPDHEGQILPRPLSLS